MQPADISMEYTKENSYKNTNMVWAHDQTIALVRSLRKHDVLWNSTSKCYRDRRRKAVAWEAVETEVGVPVDMCKRRVESLLASCRREKNKIAKSKLVDSPDMVYKPKWAYWKEFRFLRGVEDVEVDVDGEDASASVPTRPAWSPSARRPPRNRRKKTETNSDKADQSRVLQASVSKPRRDGDEHDAYGVTVAAKLRKMEENQRLLAENIINQALYKGLTYQLNLHSEQELLPRIQNDAQQQQGAPWREQPAYPTAPNDAYVVPKSASSPPF